MIGDWIPTPRQELALAVGADITIMGGANGGGKSDTLLADPTRGFSDPHFRGVVLRLTRQLLKRGGGLWDRSKSLYRPLGNKPNETELKHTLPSGAELQMTYLEESDVEAWDGAQLTWIGIDQLEQLKDQRSLFYLMGRLRSPESSWRPWLFATANPGGRDHWLTHLLEWWLDDEGYPIPERSGVKRWFHVIDDKVKWVDGREDTQTILDDKGREIEVPPRSLAFVPATVHDNPYVSNEYLSQLAGMNEHDKMEKLKGCWYVTRSGKLFSDHRIQIVDAPPALAPRCRYWDLADTEPSEKNPDPCHTAGAKLSMTEEPFEVCQDIECNHHSQQGVEKCPRCGCEEIAVKIKQVFWIEDVVWQLLEGDKKHAWMTRTAQVDGVGVTQAVEQEPGAMGKETARDRYGRDVFAGFTVIIDKVTGSKPSRWNTFKAPAAEGRVRMVAGSWTSEVLRIIDDMPDAKIKDVMDAIVGAMAKLASGEVKIQSGWEQAPVGLSSRHSKVESRRRRDGRWT